MARDGFADRVAVFREPEGRVYFAGDYATDPEWLNTYGRCDGIGGIRGDTDSARPSEIGHVGFSRPRTVALGRAWRGAADRR